MRYTLLVGTLLIAVACGQQEEKSADEPTPTPQTVVGPKGATGSEGKEGKAGAEGRPGADAVTKLIYPCGIGSATYKEVLVCLSTGELLGSFSDDAAGNETRLVIIPTGSYEDTDDSGCTFTVTAEVGRSTVNWPANQSKGWSDGAETCETRKE